MIDAINFYSSTHGGRKQNQTPSYNFGRLLKYGGDSFVSKNAAQKQTGLASSLLVGGVLGATCMIINVLSNANSLAKSDFSAMKNITKATGVVTLVSAICFGVFKCLENSILKKY